MTSGELRSLRKQPFLSHSPALIRNYLILGITFLLQTATSASADGELPLLSPFAALGLERPEVLGFAFLSLFLLNGWHFDGILATRAKIEGSIPPWLRSCRFCFASIPLLGVYVLPAWDWMTRNGINWKGRSKTATSPPSAFFHQANHVLPFLSILVWGLNLLVLYSSLAWLHTAAAQAIPAIRWGLQAIGFLCVQIEILDLRRRRRPFPVVMHLLLHLFSAFWFFPWPVCVMAGLAHIFLLNAYPEPKLRMQDFFQGRFRMSDRLDTASGRDWWRVSRWRAWRSPAWLLNSGQNFGEGGQRLVDLYRARVFFTVLDAIAFALLINTWLSAGWMLFVFGAIVLPASLLLVLTGLFVLGADFVSRHLGGALISIPYHRSSLKYLVLTQMAWLSGSWIGYLLALGDSWRLGHSLLWGGWTTSLSVWFFALPVHPGHDRARGKAGKLIPWILLSMSAACSGQLILSGSAGLADFLKRFLVWTGLASPFLGLALGFFLGRRFWDTGEGFTRFGLAVCSSLLPFGGLVLPLWVLSRGGPLQPQALPALPEIEQPRSMDVPKNVRLPVTEEREYCFSHLVPHLAAAGNLPGLFRLVEETSFLGDQIIHSKGFYKTLEDIEARIVPAAIQTRQWKRFIRFLTMAVHLRGVSEDLAESAVLRILTEQGQFQIAQDAIQGIVDPLKRAVAKAIVAGALDSSSGVHQRLVKSLTHDVSVYRVSKFLLKGHDTSSGHLVSLDRGRECS